jgi:hypothetical protein
MALAKNLETCLELDKKEEEYDEKEYQFTTEKIRHI